MAIGQRRVAMITGGNSGIGFATASKLAAQGLHVILASRNQQTSARAIERIRADNPDASVESIPLDLASFAAVPPQLGLRYDLWIGNPEVLA